MANIYVGLWVSGTDFTLSFQQPTFRQFTTNSECVFEPCS